jgi:hypothetical protein
MVEKYHYFLLVEGPRDALHLIANGIPVFAILGSKTSWHDKKALILRSLDADLAILADPAKIGSNKLKKLRRQFVQAVKEIRK